MRSTHEEPHSSCVTAFFADCALSFVLPKGATLEALAGRLASLRVGTPFAIKVRLPPRLACGHLPRPVFGNFAAFRDAIPIAGVRRGEIDIGLH